MKPIRVFTAFSGYDAQLLALERLHQIYPEFQYTCVGWSEIDKYAIQAHNALFPDLKDKNYGDICTIDWERVPDFDLFTMSSPCQDFSLAGQLRGGQEGSNTRSSLLWQCRRAILTKKPRYVLFENVKNLVGNNFRALFLQWQAELSSYGYANFAKVLNAKDYAVPQNRERVFMVSILDFDGVYHFPKEMPLTKCMADILEEHPDKRYYLSRQMVETFWRRNNINAERGNGFKFEPDEGEGIAKTLTDPGKNRDVNNYIRDERV